MSSLLKVKGKAKIQPKEVSGKNLIKVEEVAGERDKEFTRESLVPTLEELGRMVDDWKPFFLVPVNHNILVNVAPMGKGRACYGIFQGDSWINSRGEKVSEITISAEPLGMPWIEIYTTIGHELGHAYNWVSYPPRYGNNGARVAVDCSREGQYHNQFFRDTMQTPERGFVCLLPKDAGAVGWGVAKLTPEKVAEVLARITPNEDAFDLVRIQLDKPAPAKPKAKRIKFVCGCGQNCLGSETLEVTCDKCGDQLVPDVS